MSSGQSLHLNGKLKGMMGHARSGSEKQGENQKIRASWRPRGGHFKECLVSDPTVMNTIC